jgi:hypothetical protein
MECCETGAKKINRTVKTKKHTKQTERSNTGKPSKNKIQRKIKTKIIQRKQNTGKPKKT